MYQLGYPINDKICTSITIQFSSFQENLEINGFEIKHYNIDQISLLFFNDYNDAL